MLCNCYKISLFFQCLLSLIFIKLKNPKLFHVHEHISCLMFIYDVVELKMCNMSANEPALWKCVICLLLNLNYKKNACLYIVYWICWQFKHTNMSGLIDNMNLHDKWMKELKRYFNNINTRLEHYRLMELGLIFVSSFS